MTVDVPIEVTVFEAATESGYGYHYAQLDRTKPEYVLRDGNIALKPFLVKGDLDVTLSFSINSKNPISGVKFVRTDGNPDAFYVETKNANKVCRNSSPTGFGSTGVFGQPILSDNDTKLSVADVQKGARSTFCYALRFSVPQGNGADKIIADDPEVNNGGGHGLIGPPKKRNAWQRFLLWLGGMSSP